MIAFFDQASGTGKTRPSLTAIAPLFCLALHYAQRVRLRNLDPRHQRRDLAMPPPTRVKPMRKGPVFIVLLVAAVLAGCARKAENAPAANAPAPAANAPAPPPAAAAGPALPAVSDEGCALVAAYVKGEMMGDFGLPLMVRVAPAKGEVTAADLNRDLKGLRGGEAKALAAALTRSIDKGSQLDCDWKTLSVAPPTPLAPDGHAYIRFRPAIGGDVAVLDTYTNAAGLTIIGNRCLYRKQSGAWKRDECVLTALS
jgi:hypothetical protein